MNGFLNNRRFTHRAIACLALVLLVTVIAGVPAAHAERRKDPDLVARFEALAGRLPTPASVGPADATIKWQDGAMQWTRDQNCFTGLEESTTGEFVGYLGNSDVTFPRVGDLYYGHVVVGTAGNPCGGPYVHIEVILPPNTFFAIDANHPVRCFSGDFDTGAETELPTAQCPQNPGQGTYGRVFDRPNEGPWPLPQGKYIAIMFPMISVKKMSGIATNSYLVGGIQVLDGQLDPWDDPKMGVFVAENEPAVAYPDAPATNITGTGARVQAIVANHYSAGSAYVDYGTSPAYGSSAGPVAIPAGNNTTSVSADLGRLAPNTTYHWRVRFVADGTAYAGADQAFVTNGSSGGGSGIPGQQFGVYLPAVLR